MTSDAATWTREPFVVYVNRDFSADLAAATRAGALVKTLRLEGLRSEDDLYRRTSEVFEITGPMGGWPGMVDWLAGPDWLPIENGALMIFDAADARPALTVLVAGMLPAITESWRTGGLPFVAYLIGVADLLAVEQVMAEANEQLDAATRSPWSVNDSGAVPIRIG